jgi:hypothetical protein
MAWVNISALIYSPWKSGWSKGTLWESMCALRQKRAFEGVILCIVRYVRVSFGLLRMASGSLVKLAKEKNAKSVISIDNQ